MSDLHRRAADFSGARLAIYVRASDDSEDTENSVRAQQRRGEQWAESAGITDVKVYCDNDLSASLYATKDREDFDRLCADVESGDRTLIWFWTTSRQTRRLDVYVPFRDLCRRKNVAWVVKRRLYDLNDPSDLRALGNDAVNNEVFSLELSENLKLAHELRASMGRPAGQTTYGYMRSYDHRRRFAGQEPDERPITCVDAEGNTTTTTRAAVVREIFARCARREELLRIVKDFNARGIPTPRGGTQWRTSVVRRVALNRAYLGTMVHNGEVVERPGPCWTPLLQNPDGTPDEETFYAARSFLLDPSRRTNRATHSVHLLTNIIRCDVCGGPLAGVKVRDYRWSTTNEREIYRCFATNAHVSIRKESLDQFVGLVIAGYLAREDVYADLLSAADTSAEQGRIRGELERLRNDLEEWQSLAERGEVTPTSFARAEKGLLAQIDRHESELEAVCAPPLLAGRIGPNPAESWDEIDFQVKRKIIRMCAEIRIKPVGRGFSNVPVSERVVWRWKVGPASQNSEPVEFPRERSTYDLLNDRAEVEFAEMLAAGRLPGVMLIRRTFRLGQRRATVIREYLRTKYPDAVTPHRPTGKHLSGTH